MFKLYKATEKAGSRFLTTGKLYLGEEIAIKSYITSNKLKYISILKNDAEKSESYYSYRLEEVQSDLVELLYN